MTRSSFKSNKRQKELAKKEKKELKRQRKIDKKAEKEEAQHNGHDQVLVDNSAAIILPEE